MVIHLILCLGPESSPSHIHQNVHQHQQVLSSLMISSNSIGLENPFAGPPGNKQQLYLASLNPKGKIMGFKAIRDHSTSHSNFPTFFHASARANTERGGLPEGPESIPPPGCLAAWAQGQLGARAAESSPTSFAGLGHSAAGRPQPGLIPLPAGPAFKLCPFHLAPV